MIQIDEPRTPDQFTVKPEKFPSLQCDPCGEGADVSKDLKKHKEIKCERQAIGLFSHQIM